MSVINMWINRYILAGRGSIADGAPTNEVVVDANGAMQVLRVNSAGVAAENTQGTLLASAARTTSPPVSVQTNYNARGVNIYLNVTASSGTGGLNLYLQNIDPVTGQATELTLASSLTTNGFRAYHVYPGASGAGWAAVFSQGVGRSWGIRVGHTDTSSYTYSIGYSLII